MPLFLNCEDGLAWAAYPIVKGFDKTYLQHKARCSCPALYDLMNNKSVFVSDDKVTVIEADAIVVPRYLSTTKECSAILALPQDGRSILGPIPVQILTGLFCLQSVLTQQPNWPMLSFMNRGFRLFATVIAVLACCAVNLLLRSGFSFWFFFLQVTSLPPPPLLTTSRLPPMPRTRWQKFAARSVTVPTDFSNAVCLSFCSLL
jgi:hypothetical protein